MRAGRPLLPILFAIWVAVSFSAPYSFAQSGNTPLENAIEILASRMVHSLGANMRGSDAPIFLDNFKDSSLEMACQPLSTTLTYIFREKLLDAIKRSDLRLNIDQRQRMDDGGAVISLSFQRRANGLALNAAISQLSAGVSNLDSGNASLPIDALSPEDRICLDFEDHSGIRCTANFDIPLKTSPLGTEETFDHIERGNVFWVRASFNEGKTLLIESRGRHLSGQDQRGFFSFPFARLRTDPGMECVGLDPHREASKFDPSAPSRECNVCPEMVALEATHSAAFGSHQDEAGRDADELSAREITIRRRFAIATQELTAAEWNACAEEKGCAPLWVNIRGNIPVAVNLRSANEYLSWLSRKTGGNYRLPTEAEWEYAARAGKQTRYHWGDTMRESEAVCRTCGGDHASPSPVAGRRPNAFGVFDMHGNLWEWVAECKDGAMPDSGQLCQLARIKGGSFRDDALLLRAGNRHYASSDMDTDNIGLRVVRNLEQ